MNNLPVYRIEFNPQERSHGMFGLSLVDNPAIQSDFIYMSEQETEQKFLLASEEKREIVGAFLVPNKLIYREKNGLKFNLYFAEEDVKNILLQMSKDGFNNWFTLQHEYAIGDVYMFETWIKEFDQDKSNEYGFNEPIGTAFCKVKVDNNDVWEEIKTNGVKGFSVELKADIKMSEQVQETVVEQAPTIDFNQKLSELEQKFEAKFDEILNLMKQNQTVELKEDIAIEQPEVEATIAMEETVAEPIVEPVVELSEDEAEKQLLSEQSGEEVVELSEQKKEAKILNRTDPMFFKKMNQFLGIK